MPTKKKQETSKASKPGEQKLNGIDTEQDMVQAPLEEGQVIAITPPESTGGVDLVKMVEDVERNIAAYKKIWKLSLRLTKPRDWVFQNKSLYLLDSGSEQLATVWGISLKLHGKPEKEWIGEGEDRYFRYVAYGEGRSQRLGKSVEDIGTCSSRDKLFGRVSGGFKPVEDVDVNMICKKAVTNLHNRIIKRMLGLMNIDEERLKDAGVDTSKIMRIDFDQGKQKVQKTATPEEKEKQKQIWNWLIRLAAGNDEEAKAMLKDLSGFTAKNGDKVEGVESVERLTTPKWISFVYKKVKQKYEADYEREPGEEG